GRGGHRQRAPVRRGPVQPRPDGGGQPPARGGGPAPPAVPPQREPRVPHPADRDQGLPGVPAGSRPGGPRDPEGHPAGDVRKLRAGHRDGRYPHRREPPRAGAGGAQPADADARPAPDLRGVGRAAEGGRPAQGHRARLRLSRRGPPAAGGPRAAAPGGEEDRRQRGQGQPVGGKDRRAGQGLGRRPRAGGRGHRDRHPARAPDGHLREVLRGRRRDDPPRGRRRHGPLPRAGDRAPAQRLGRGAQPARTGQRVRGAAAPPAPRGAPQPGPGVTPRRAALAALLPAAPPPGGPPAAAAPAPSPGELLDRLAKAWHDRDLGAYLGLWSFATPEAQEAERSMAAERFIAEESTLDIQRPDPVAPGAKGRLLVNAQAFSALEPRGRVAQWLLTLEEGSDGWRGAGREVVGSIDGLVHLSLDPHGYRADGLTMQFDDLTLEMEHGTLFTSPAAVGPTALLFVGEATVRFRPWPETEREQLRQFS